MKYLKTAALAVLGTVALTAGASAAEGKNLSRAPYCAPPKRPRYAPHLSARSSQRTYKSRGADGACRLGRAIHRFLHPSPQRIVVVPCS
jgi:hypothetical protein